MPRLTDKELLNNPALGDLVHVVDVSDTTDHPEGTSKRATLDSILALAVAEADKYFIQQFTGLSTVIVTHNLGKYPSPIIFDSAGDEVEGDIRHDSVNQLTVTFNASNSGTIICN